LVEDPDSTAQDLNKIITNDPALGARILKVVNSAFYGLPGQIASINRAIVLLGLNAVKNIAIAASLAKLFRGGQICPGFDPKDLWIHSVAVATATKQLGDRSGLGLPDEAFLAGLIHDVGIMVEIQARRAKFVEVFDQFQANEKMSLRQAEQNVLGANHEHFGAALCKAWKFPNSLTYVTGFHHRPLELAPQFRTLTSLVHIADIVAARAEVGMSVSVDTREVASEILESVRLTQQIVDEVCEQLPQAMEQADVILREAA
jgi:HD-like signal output (HDOD) protein